QSTYVVFYNYTYCNEIVHMRGKPGGRDGTELQVRKLESAALERRRTAARIVATEDSKPPANASKLSRMSMRLMRGTEDLIGSKSREYDCLPVHGELQHCTPDMIIVTGRKGLNQRINGIYGRLDISNNGRPVYIKVQEKREELICWT
ncbi:hypothetical protein FOZ63_014699, partial [Perkinsus olseni]